MKKIKIIIIAAGFIAAAILYSFSGKDSEAVLLKSGTEAEAFDSDKGPDSTAPGEAANCDSALKEDIESLKTEISGLKESIELLKKDGINIVLSDTSAQSVEAVYFPESGQQEDSGLVNINTADKDELMELPGIGESKADSIISYREDYGAFESIEEIMNISGIKEAAFEKLKDKITV